MERLTYTTSEMENNGIDCPVKADNDLVDRFCNQVCDEFENNCPYAMMGIKLKEYEDIGIPTDDIIDILSVMSESQDDVDDQGISIGMIHDLVELMRYRETGFTPQQMQQKNIELEYWHRQALTYAAQLGEIRIWQAEQKDKAVNKDE